MTSERKWQWRYIGKSVSGRPQGIHAMCRIFPNQIVIGEEIDTVIGNGTAFYKGMRIRRADFNTNSTIVTDDAMELVRFAQGVLERSIEATQLRLGSLVRAQTQVNMWAAAIEFLDDLKREVGSDG